MLEIFPEINKKISQLEVLKLKEKKQGLSLQEMEEIQNLNKHLIETE
jgi:hypothetical protein